MHLTKVTAGCRPAHRHRATTTTTSRRRRRPTNKGIMADRAITIPSLTRTRRTATTRVGGKDLRLSTAFNTTGRPSSTTVRRRIPPRST